MFSYLNWDWINEYDCSDFSSLYQNICLLEGMIKSMKKTICNRNISELFRMAGCLWRLALNYTLKESASINMWPLLSKFLLSSLGLLSKKKKRGKWGCLDAFVLISQNCFVLWFLFHENKNGGYFLQCMFK